MLAQIFLLVFTNLKLILFITFLYHILGVMGFLSEEFKIKTETLSNVSFLLK